MLNPTEFVAQWMDNGLARVYPDYAVQWGSDDLHTYNAAIVNSLAIPKTSKRFLLEAGLPVKASKHYNFAVGNVVLQPVPEILSHLEESGDYLRYRILGFRGFDAPP